jgi:hypothetical protein
MRNIFMVYMPPNNAEAMTHYRDTIQQRVALDRITCFVPGKVATRLRKIFGDRPAAVWGSRDSPANRRKFDKMLEGDDLLIVEGGVIKLMGKIALKTVNPDLSRELWKNINTDRSGGWDLIYFIANAVEIDVPFREFCRLFGYNTNMQLRGFSNVADEKVKEFYDQFDDLYDILMRIRAGQSITRKPSIDQLPTSESNADATPVGPEPDPGTDSRHVEMQWKLARLGRKAGQKVWIPFADQGRLRRAYESVEFEAEFAAGIDLPKNYVENIDVIWKEEFRIDAAFEVESTTAIYSGLLRFADLTTLAPNTLYPMFIVAPVERRARVREQLYRPSFKRLGLPEKVMFLPYETVDDIDKMFAGVDVGVSVELIKAKAEVVAQ